MKTRSTSPIILLGGTIGVACCLAWIFITENKLTNLLKNKKGKTKTLKKSALKEPKFHELGQKYMNSFR